MKIRDIAAYVFLITSAGWVLFHLVLLLMYGGEVMIYEDSVIILWVEIVMTVGIVGLGVERVISICRVTNG